jgi:hypothetical protein
MAMLKRRASLGHERVSREEDEDELLLFTSNGAVEDPMMKE